MKGTEDISGISEEIIKIIVERLVAFNRGKTADKGRYYILLPDGKTPYYTLWFYNPAATFHPMVFLENLELNAIGSVNKAIRTVGNSFLPLTLTRERKALPGNGDDILSFGKYRGYHLRDIYAIDPRYVIWLADKFEPKVKSEVRFKEMAVTYARVYLDLHTRKRYKVPVSRFVGNIGDKLTDLTLTVIKTRLEDDPYKTRVERGTEYFYVDQLLTAADPAGNLFRLSIKARTPSLATRTLPAGARSFHAGETLRLASAKVLRHVESKQVKYTKIGYLKFAADGVQ